VVGGEVEREWEVYAERADRLIDALRETHDRDDVVGLVSHGWFGNVLLGRLLGIVDMNGAFELANASMSLLEDTEDAVPWDVTAIRLNWFPHLAADQVSGSALNGQVASEMP
jgi:broad specificity phosphatase PhoE